MRKDKSSVTPAPALVLFDIDGTLIRRAGPHHRQALVDAVRDVTGLETTTENIPVHGMLDPDILTSMMRNAGASGASIRKAMPGVMDKAQSLYVRRCPDLSEKLCPGVIELLAGLQERGIPLALVTGNLTRIGWRKMRRSGLDRYFQYGAFAEMARNRSGLARLAIRHARRQGWIDGGAVISLIGDAPSDILAARANGAMSVAVHTGISTREELEAHQPDLLLEDLRNLRVDSLVNLTRPLLSECKLRT
jgi:phosphoglycolate phosphatase-like HAD superfamily hydrolase